MHRLLNPISFGVVALVAQAVISQAEVPQVDAERFEALRAEVRPDSEEQWRQIPWRISLLEAQREAVAAGKPLFIWAMDGHPLGCT